MEAPGEKLVLRLWDSIEKLTIGILKPTQMKRLAKVESELALQKLLDDEKANRITLELVLKNKKEDAFPKDILLSDSILNQRLREELNATNSIVHAHKELSGEKDAKIPKQEVEEDWVHRWYSYASKVSNDELQQLWGKILSGEIKKPNTMSYRLMDFIDKLTALEIDEISLLLSLVEKKNNIIFRGKEKTLSFFENNGITSDLIQKYSDLGVLSTSTTGVVNVTTNLDFTKCDYYHFNYGSNNVSVSLNEDKKEKKTALYYGLGSIGIALLKLSNYPSNNEYLLELQSDFNNFNISFDISNFSA
jgi:hypothetical protein